MSIDSDLLDLLACPACHAPFTTPSANPESLTCSGCGLQFPVVEGIPVLLMDDAMTPDPQGQAGA